MLGNVVYFVVGCLTTYGFLKVFKHVNKNCAKNDFIVYFLIIINSLSSLFLNILSYDLLKILVSFVLLFIMFNYVSKNKSLILVKSFYVWLIGISFDFISMIVISLFVEKLPTNQILILIMQAGSGISLFIFLSIFSRLKIAEVIYDKFSKLFLEFKYKVVFIVIAILTIMFISFESLENITITSALIPLCIIFSLLILSAFLFLKNNYISKTYKKTIKLLLENTDFHTEILQEYKVFKHNLNNQLLTLMSVGNEKSKLLIAELIEDYNKSNISYSEINKLPNEINGFIYQKICSSNMIETNILVNCSVKTKVFDCIKPKTYNSFCTTIGVILDNAFEASKDSINKNILIDFIEDEENYLMKVCNEFNNEVDINKIGTLNYSTKNRKSGIGLFSIFQKSNIMTTTKIVSNVFIVTIAVKKDND